MPEYHQLPETITVRGLAKRMCASWNFPGTWLAWPPDLFAFTSTVLEYTGVYRTLITDVWGGGPTWQKEVETAAQVWVENVNEFLFEHNRRFIQFARRNGGSEPGDDKIEWRDQFKINGHAVNEKNSAKVKYYVQKAIDAVTVLEQLGEMVTLADLRTFPGKYEVGNGVLGEYPASEDGSVPGDSGLRTGLLTCPEAEISRALIFLHAIADEASGNFGLLTAMRRKTAAVRFFGNLMLTSRGSLSTIPKHWATVLPKMRTPQRGFTIRSFSHHLTCHATEVEMMWRVAPMLNLPHNTLNILTIPWPETVDLDSFEACTDTFRHWRSFNYDPKDAEPLPISKIARLIDNLNDDGLEPHVVVLPEASVSASEFATLLTQLKDDYQKSWRANSSQQSKKRPNSADENQADDQPGDQQISTERTHIPIVIAGVRTTGDMSVARHRYKEKAHLNEVRLAIYFAGKWYVLGQRKHHRWQLDQSQIKQYQLEGKLSTERDWFEKIQLGQRRLSVLAPNSWLAICPLICEDLAQLEPVSEMIRGVAPTLLISLLMDGPQLPERWAARYASVFADDPGTAVLNQTSLGMCSRSRKIKSGVVVKSDPPNWTVASWKDPTMGFQPLEQKETKDGLITNAMLLTIKSKWTEEYTADGRSDYQNAATLEFEGARMLSLDTKDLETEEVLEENGKASSHGLSDISGNDLDDEVHIGLWHDLREHTIALYLIDAIIELRGEHWSELSWWIKRQPINSVDHDEVIKAFDGKTRKRYMEMLYVTYTSLINPHEAGVTSPLGEREREAFHSEEGITEDSSRWPSKTLERVAKIIEGTVPDFSSEDLEEEMSKVISQNQMASLLDPDPDLSTGEYWRSLVDEAIATLRASDWPQKRTREEVKKSSVDGQKNIDLDWNIGRLGLALPLIVLVLIHYRLDKLRGVPPVDSHLHDVPICVQSPFEKVGLSYDDASRLWMKIQEAFREHGR